MSEIVAAPEILNTKFEESKNIQENNIESESTSEAFQCMSPKVGSKKDNKTKIRKKFKSKKKHRSSDPVINSISDLMSTSLNIVSPDKLVSREDTQVIKKVTNINLGKNIDAELNKSIEEMRSKFSPSSQRTSSSPSSKRKSLSPICKKKSLSPISKRKSSSPNTTKKFKECSQQTKLSGFVQIISSPKTAKINEEIKIDVAVMDIKKPVDNTKLKLSSNLFKSPRKAKQKNVEKKLSREDEKINEETCSLSNSSEINLTPKKVNNENGKKMFGTALENVRKYPEMLDEVISEDINLLESQDRELSVINGKVTPKKVKKPKKKKLSLLENAEESDVTSPCKENNVFNNKVLSIISYEENSSQNLELERKHVLLQTKKSFKNNESVIDETISNKEILLPNLGLSLNAKTDEISSDSSQPHKFIINESSSSQSLHSLHPDEVSKSSIPSNEERSSRIIQVVETSSSVDMKDESEISPQKDVFRFMMDARHKSIGMNLDGKIIENTELNDPIVKKASLKSRKERLEEWNKSKGAIKRKLEEEAREEYVSAALDKRAKRMKKMLSIKESKKRKVVSDSDSSLESIKDISPRHKRIRKSPVILEETVDVETFNRAKNLESTSKVQSGLLSFFGVLNEQDRDDKVENKRENVSKIKTVSPDLNKKMLGKNHKFGKEMPCEEPVKAKRGRPKKISKSFQDNKAVLSTVKADQQQVNENSYVKKCKHYKKIEDDDSVPVTVQELNESSSDSLILIKAKIEEDSITGFNLIQESSNDSTTSTDAIPKKKYVKRNKNKTDNVGISLSLLRKKIQFKLNSKDSDDSLDTSGDVFSPRRSSRAKVSKTYVDEDSMDNSETEKKNKKTKKKVAPVFTQMVRPKIDPEVLKARREFLYSGVPSTLKKNLEKQASINNEEFDVFPVISHVQQKPQNQSKFWNLSKVDLEFKDIEESTIKVENLKWTKVVDVQTCDRKIQLEIPKKPILSKNILEKLKDDNPDYPVYKMFRLLREKAGHKTDVRRISPRKKKRGRQKKSLTDVNTEQDLVKNDNNLEFAMWTEKYKPKSSEDIIGNVKCIKELKSWLDSWMEFTVEMKGRKRRRGGDSSDFETTDGESRDNLRIPGNCMLLRGPPGSGKTSSIYAICNELGINVLELNASSKRTGKRLLQELQEATQSHQVRNSENNSLSSFLQQNVATQMEKSRDKSKMCLLLVEDVDIVFDQDEGFISALIQLLTTSKRPIALISSDISSNHIHKFLHYPTLIFRPLPSESLSVWLQLVCLNEGLHISKSSISELLNSNRGDMRKTLLQLQFWTKTGGDSINKKQFKYLRDSQKTNTNFNDYLYKDELAPKLVDDDSDYRLHEDCVHSFIDFCNTPLSYPVDLEQFWWNLPEIILKPSMDADGDSEKLSTIYKLYDALSLSDTLYRNEEISTNTELCPKRWQFRPQDSLSLKEDFSSFRPSIEITHQISHSLINGYSKLEKSDLPIRTNLAVPTTEQKRWRTSRFECEEVFDKAVPMSCFMDRKSYSTDYFPTLRQICRTEAKRSQVNHKRNNRFYNYIKTLNVNAEAKTIATACDILSKY